MGMRSRFLALSLTVAAGSATAAGSVADMFSYNGFGTAGVARSDTNRAEYVSGNQMAGASENFDYKTDSKLGLQGTFSPTSWLSGTVQVLAGNELLPGSPRSSSGRTSRCSRAPIFRSGTEKWNCRCF